ncbi:MAG: methylenetetrahydrofolate--tRNA-(uracil(54)-C(5))-methyltransferase (FADH(2)-oxidizing) TrmFO [Clostridiales bacterium]
MKNYINVIGAGLAGIEAAWQIAKRGIHVRLYEMKPKKYSPAHKNDYFAELVCSNSFRANNIENAVGLLKEEMRFLDSIIIKCADMTSVPAGGALAVDREKFSKLVTKEIMENKNIEIIIDEIKSIPKDSITIIATGPLTSDDLSKEIINYLGKDYLHFFDAAAPIVSFDSINMNIAFKASRYGRGTADYINCPMDREQYLNFYEELKNAELAPVKDFEDKKIFEGCMPIESMAKRGIDTMRFGPLKPVGIEKPGLDKKFYAVVQLRQDNSEGSMFNLVGFQTHLKWSEQNRIFKIIPGLEKAEFIRYGVMHRNTYINSPMLLDSTYNLKDNSKIFFAGQITGVEGYVESASSGLIAGINAANLIFDKEKIFFTNETAIGSLVNYISDSSIRNFQPMNVNFGIMKKLDFRVKNKKEKNSIIAKRALKFLENLDF